MAVAVEREAHRRVSCSRRHLLRVGPGGHPQRHRRVPQVVWTEVCEPRLAHGGSPEALAQDVELHGPTLGCGEDEVVWLAAVSAQVFGQRVGRHPGSGTLRWPARILGGPK